MIIRRGVFIIATFVLLLMAGYQPPMDLMWDYLQSIPESERGMVIGILITLTAFMSVLMIREGICLLLKTTQILNRLEDIENHLHQNDRD